jgi:ferredoxin
MDSHLRSQVVFHLTGRQPGEEASSGAVPGLRPALLAAYRHLDSLRYDFPVVFCGGEDFVQSLSSVVDRALRKLAPEGVPGEGMRRRVLKVEKEIRGQVAAGARGSLGELWDKATESLAEKADEAFVRDVRRVRDALGLDGEVAGCDAALPGRFMRHAWSVVRKERAKAGRERIERLVIRLGEILRADYMRSEQALQKPALKASFGAAHHALFDFAAMSKVLQWVGPTGGLNDRRRARIERALSVLNAQRFFASDRKGDGTAAYEFAFDDLGAALAAFRERLPELAALLGALQAAELEVEGNYIEELHDPIFAALDEDRITAQDLQFFPDYLVCIASREDGTQARLAEALSSGVPIKLVVQVEDLLEETSPGRGQFAFGLRSSQLASAAMSFDEVFVLQTAASNLVQLRSRLRRGLMHSGPALFSLYAGPAAGVLPGYLASAAAMQSRAFPAFSYDPAAGTDLASRLSLENNPQPERDWPVEKFSYADQDLQSVTVDAAFTFVDFVACDPRYSGHFAPVARAAWGEAMIPVHEWLENPPQNAASGVPYVLAVDDGDLLCRLVVDERLMRAAIRCREAWHRMQELGGIHDSRAERLLARERQAWEEERQRELRAATAAAAATPAAAIAAQPAQAATDAAAPAPASAAAEPPEPARNPDEPYIETIRCSTCNECTQLNPRMFAYNDNKQAYIADLKAGTYAQMVQAAESCQVSVIHPGKPWDPTEPGLDELIERAKPFL